MGGLGLVRLKSYGGLLVRELTVLTVILRLETGSAYRVWAKVFICRLGFSRFLVGVAVFHLRDRGCPVPACNYEGGLA